MSPDKDDSRVWLITGASSGLGRAIAERALEHGDRVVATARDPERVRGFEERYPGAAISTRLDVTDPDQAQAAVNDGLAAFDRIDVVVNNAGYGLFGSLEELSAEDLRREFETNVFGALNVIRASLPQLRAQREGHLIQISSLEGVAPLLAGETAYAATKFAVEGVSEALAREVDHLGIRVTIVEPGPIRTDFAEGAKATAPEIEDYGESVGKALETFDDLAGNQPNDPGRTAEAIVRAVHSDDAPLRLVLGEEAVEAVRAKLELQLAELEGWERLSLTTAAA